MLSTPPRTAVREFPVDLYWFALAAFFLTIGTIGMLGEWVFHW
jgi:hypothetical protein